MAKITFKGITQNSSISAPISDETFYGIEKDYFKKPDIEDVRKQLRAIHRGGSRANMVYNYFFKEVASKAIGPGASWSIWDGIHNREIMEYFAGKFARSPQFYPDTTSFAENLEVAFRLCGIRYCVKCPNYPLTSVQQILNAYNINNVWYDFSCGWGTRLLGALQKNIEYYGTDPNNELVEKLDEMQTMYKAVNNSNSGVHLYMQGSQEFIPEMVGKIGLAFSSPPYFDLEDYQIGNQSYKPGTSYQSWLTDYLRPTMENIYKYLIDDGCLVINIKNIIDRTGINRDLEKDTQDVIQSCGFKLVEITTLKNIKRCHGDIKNTHDSADKSKLLINNDEKIFVFKKNAASSNIVKQDDSSISLF